MVLEQKTLPYAPEEELHCVPSRVLVVTQGGNTTPGEVLDFNYAQVNKLIVPSKGSLLNISELSARNSRLQ